MPWTEPPKNLQGLPLYGNLVVGPQLGQGAQAVVHAVLDSSAKGKPTPTEWVVKLAKTANPKLPKKKFQEANRDVLSLNGERQRYKASFRDLPTVVPKIPNMTAGPHTFEGRTSGTLACHWQRFWRRSKQ